MLTVFIATLNGARTLPRVLEAYGALENPGGGWKLVVIDNGSTDDTLNILESYTSRLPLTYFSAPERGKNVALNAGLSRLEGDLAVFTDDDILPSTGWLRTLRSRADAQPEYSIFGGPIRPSWDSPPPDWVLSSVPRGPAFALIEGHEGPTRQSSIIGGNMAVRAEVFGKVSRFNESRGPRGKNYVMGGEVDFLIRLSREGYRFWFCEEAFVLHVIRPYQLTTDWLYGRARRWGAGEFRLHQASLVFPSWFGVPRWMVRTIVTRFLEYWIERMRFRADKAFVARWEMNVTLGRAIEARKAHERKDTDGGSDSA